MSNVPEKKSYHRPTLSRIGAVGEVTLANGDGARLDNTFPVNTPFADLQFTSS
jgi:hypothetical protein